MKSHLFSFLREGSWRGLIAHVLLISLAVIVLIILFFFTYLPKVTNHGETIIVPDLEGMQLEEMDEFLGKRNFRFEVADSGYSSLYPPLTVLKQYPRGGSYVKENRKIYLTVKAKQPQSVKMPDLIDGSLKNAELVLQSYGLKLGEITYKPDLASNAVLEQYFESEVVLHGTSIPKGSTIDLVVGDGLGNSTFPAPNFVGLELEEADFSIVGSGLNTGIVMIQVLDDEELDLIIEELNELPIDTVMDIESGHVYRQRPKVGSEIRLGEQVDLWIASMNEEDSLEILELWQDIKNDNSRDTP
jgi:beta-lactam-binding protein with PASTA domain